MESIKIDNDVFAHLQKHARPFVDTPNSTLRRLLNIDVAVSAASQKNSTPSAVTELDELLAESLAAASSRSKAPKADLEALVKMDFLQNGQKLYLVDYQGNRVQKLVAVISGGDVIYNNQRYSMSNLAQELLASIGFKSNSVRGPAHWVTEEGKSIKQLWQQHLDQPTKRKQQGT
jgi:Mor family transcriptional regulator